MGDQCKPHWGASGSLTVMYEHAREHTLAHAYAPRSIDKCAITLVGSRAPSAIALLPMTVLYRSRAHQIASNVCRIQAYYDYDSSIHVNAAAATETITTTKKPSHAHAGMYVYASTVKTPLSCVCVCEYGYGLVYYGINIVCFTLVGAPFLLLLSSSMIDVVF